MASKEKSGSDSVSPVITRPADSEDDIAADFDLGFVASGQSSPAPILNGGNATSPEGEILFRPQNRVSATPSKLPKARQQSSHVVDIRGREQVPSVTSIKRESSEAPWKFSAAECIELSDSEHVPFDISIKKESQTLWNYSKAELVELSDSEQMPFTTPIKNENSTAPWKFSEAELIELSDSEYTHFDISVKKEEVETLWKFSDAERIELSDSEQTPFTTPIKHEKSIAPWKFLGAERIELSDSEHEIICRSQNPADSSIFEIGDQEHHGQDASQYQGLPNSQKCRREGDQGLHLGSQDQYLDSGEAHPQTTMSDQSNMGSQSNGMSNVQNIQRMLAERALGKPLVGSADVILNNFQASHSRASGIDTENSHDWMNATIDSDMDPGATYVFY